jgi:hypothetical protein
MTILYAEDDSMTVMEVQEKLENNGYEVIVAYVRGIKRNAIN